MPILNKNLDKKSNKKCLECKVNELLEALEEAKKEIHALKEELDVRTGQQHEVSQARG